MRSKQAKKQIKKIKNHDKDVKKQRINRAKEEERRFAKPKAKPTKPKFQIIVMTAVWAMIIFMILGVVLPAVSTLFQQYY